jgi:hypothetical protein
MRLVDVVTLRRRQLAGHLSATLSRIKKVVEIAEDQREGTS